MKNMYLSLLFLVLVCIGVLWKVNSNMKTEEKPILTKTEYAEEFKKLSDADVKTIWSEAPIGTVIDDIAYNELKRRGYFEILHSENEQKALNIADKYIKR